MCKSVWSYSPALNLHLAVWFLVSHNPIIRVLLIRNNGFAKNDKLKCWEGHSGTNALLNFYRHKLLIKLLINTCHLKDLTVWARKRIIEPELSWVFAWGSRFKIRNEVHHIRSPIGSWALATSHRSGSGEAARLHWYPPPATDSEVIRCFRPKQWDNTAQKKKVAHFFLQRQLYFRVQTLCFKWITKDIRSLRSQSEPAYDAIHRLSIY